LTEILYIFLPLFLFLVDFLTIFLFLPPLLPLDLSDRPTALSVCIGCPLADPPPYIEFYVQIVCTVTFVRLHLNTFLGGRVCFASPNRHTEDQSDIIPYRLWLCSDPSRLIKALLPSPLRLRWLLPPDRESDLFFSTTHTEREALQ
jgi:hypothetical protein